LGGTGGDKEMKGKLHWGGPVECMGIGSEPRGIGRAGALSPKWRRGGTWAAWIDTVLCVAAMLGMGISLVPDLRQAKTLDYVATDFKTLYASTALFAEGKNPYDLGEFADVYRRNGVVTPGKTFGRMPVYPPATLLVLAPLALLPMGSAAAVWFGLSLAAMALALGMVLREARARELGLGWRLGIIGVAAGSPLLGFALNIGNVSVAVAGLAIAASMLALQPLRAELWMRGCVLAGVALALAACLKPHIAVWMGVGIALAAGRAGRWIAGVALAGFVGTGLASLGVVAARGTLETTLHSLVAMLAEERVSGSMSPTSREVLPIGAQITGLQSLFGLWVGGWMRMALVALILLALGGTLLWAVRRLRQEDALLFVLTMTAVGMIATYHRAHDELVLMPVALWICTELKRRITSIWGWSVLGLVGGTWYAIPSKFELTALRQAALFSCCLACVLVGCVGWSALRAKKGGTNDPLSVPGGQ
jgi:hypothetical protein